MAIMRRIKSSSSHPNPNLILCETHPPSFAFLRKKTPSNPAEKDRPPEKKK
jgi:hypothetical protein